MESMIIKLKRIIYEGYKGLRYFNISVSFAKIRCILQNESIKSLQYKNKMILRYLNKHYSHIVAKYINSVENDNCKLTNSPIWVLWWQGSDNMPNIIRTCQNSRLKFANGHPVILLDKYNIRDYVDFPDFIWEKFDQGMLRVQHLADMIRVRLIRNYGGLWIDASILCNRNIPNYIFQLPIYSLKYSNNNFTNISNDKWTTFLIGGTKGNILCCFLDDLFMEYCKDNKPFIDYFMFDCMIAFAKEKLDTISKSLDLIPEYKGNYRFINEHAFDHYSGDVMDLLNEEGSIFYKIAWGNQKAGLDKNSLFSHLEDLGKNNEKS